MMRKRALSLGTFVFALKLLLSVAMAWMSKRVTDLVIIPTKSVLDYLRWWWPTFPFLLSYPRFFFWAPQSYPSFYLSQCSISNREPSQFSFWIVMGVSNDCIWSVWKHIDNVSRGRLPSVWSAVWGRMLWCIRFRCNFSPYDAFIYFWFEYQKIRKIRVITSYFNGRCFPHFLHQFDHLLHRLLTGEVKFHHMGLIEDGILAEENSDRA